MARVSLVTGGLGFIGSHLVELLLSEEQFVIVVDKGGIGSSIHHLPFNHPNLLRVIADIRNQSILERLLKDVDDVYHLAAESHVDRSLKSGTPFIQSNVEGTVSLLEACRRHPVQRIVYVSTDEVYGERTEPADESQPCHPNNPYALSKWFAEQMCQYFQRTYNLPIIITRGCNTYGPRQHEEKFLPKLILSILNSEEFPLYGDGMQIREWIWVKDHADAIRKVAQDGEIGKVYNIGTDDRRSNTEMIELVQKIMGKQADVVHVKDRINHDRSYAISSHSIRRLGWTPSMTLEEGLRHTVTYYEQQIVRQHIEQLLG